MNEQLISQIALTSIPNIGDVTAKKLIAYCGGTEQIFKEKPHVLEKIPVKKRKPDYDADKIRTMQQDVVQESERKKQIVKDWEFRDAQKDYIPENVKKRRRTGTSIP